MKKFLAIYLASASDSAMLEWKALDEEPRKKREKAGIQRWKDWAEENKKSILDQGSPLGKTTRIDKDGITNGKNLITAYTLIEAESKEEAAKLFLDHPHFMIFPGESVEIMECLPLPK